MSKYAVLSDLDSGEGRVGVVLDRSDGVRVYLPSRYGLPDRYSGQYRVLQPDGGELVYAPGRPGYFDQVLVDISRMFAIAKVDQRDIGDDGDVALLLLEELVRPTQESRGHYAPLARPIRFEPRVGVAQVARRTRPLAFAA